MAWNATICPNAPVNYGFDNKTVNFVLCFYKISPPTPNLKDVGCIYTASKELLFMSVSAKNAD
jgi:hypothetical protein